MDDQGIKELRNHKRISLIEDILIDGTKLCRSTDISEGGLFVSAIQFFEEGNVVEVTIPFGEEKLTAKAQVMYYQPGIGMGLMFLDLKDEQKAKIKGFVESVQGA